MKRALCIVKIALCQLLCTMILFGHAYAQWSWDPTINNAVSTYSGNQQYTQVCGDGSGGAIITWEDNRMGANYDVYAQRIDANGVIQWMSDGIPVCAETGDQWIIAICSDGYGGAIIAWTDARGNVSDVYAQRISAAGIAQWTTSGVAVCTAPGDQKFVSICSDGSGGAILTWHDTRAAQFNYDIYAQRLNAAGVAQWTVNGTAICTAPSGQTFPRILSDGNGGAFIAWEDRRSGLSETNIYIQRINASGTVQWTTDGVAVCMAPRTQQFHEICSDGAGGAIITWDDLRSGSSGTHFDIYAQRINAAGTVLWANDGAAICTIYGEQNVPQICSDGSGGAIIVWEDNRSGWKYDIYAQRINAAGSVEWSVNGKEICTNTGNTVNPQGIRAPRICSDGNGGANITWMDSRYGAYSNIYAQRIDGSGAVLWTANGNAVSLASGSQFNPTIVKVGNSEVICTWSDNRSGSSTDVYASKISPSGQIVPVEMISFNVHRTGSMVTLRWETASEVTNYGFEVERMVNDRPWEKQGFVPGRGSPSTAHEYRYYDRLPGSTFRDGIGYYRLRQIDYDGSFSYSPVVSVMLDDGSSIPVMVDLYPNPVKEFLAVSLSIPDECIVSIRLFDMAGHCRIGPYESCRFTSGSYSAVLDMSHLICGTYILEVMAGDQKVARKVEIVR